MGEIDPNLDMFDKTKVVVWEQGQLGGRIRPINQDVLFSNLCEIVDVFDKHEIKYALSHGTLLALVRYNGQLFPWDDDIDLTFFIEDISKLKKAEKELKKLGFYIPKRTENPDDKVNPLEKQFYFDANFIKDGEKVEGWGVEKIGNKWVYDKPRCGLAWNEKFFNKLGTVIWRDRTFSCPDFKDEYLLLMYGNYPINEANAHRKYKHQS